MTNYAGQFSKAIVVPTLRSKGECQISIYSQDTPLTFDQMEAGFNKLRELRPNLPASFYNILTEQVVKMGFSATRFMDAIDSVIRYNNYRDIQPAAVLSYDKSYRMISYKKMLYEISSTGGSTDDYAPIKVIKDGKEYTYFVAMEDKIRYNIPDIM